MRHQAVLTMSAMIAITLAFSYLAELASPDRMPRADPRPHIRILATGGTAGVTVDDLMRSVPQIDDIAELSSEQVANVRGEDMCDRIWLDVAARTNELLEEGDAQGVVVTQGPDTIEETAFFLNLVIKSDKPVVLAGSPNLFSAVAAAADPDARGRGVLVAMRNEIHAARLVTRSNTTSLQTFVSPGHGPVGIVQPSRITWSAPPERTHTTRSEFSVGGVTTLPRVDIIYVHAGMSPDLVTAAVERGARGLVLAGVGDGDVSRATLDVLARVARTGVVVVRSTRLERGMVLRNVNVNDDKMGFVASGDLNAPKSRVLLELALMETKDPRRIQQIFDEY